LAIARRFGSSFMLRFSLIVGSAAAFSTPASAAPVWSDPLTGSQVDPTRWTTSASSPDTRLTPASDGVLMSLAGTARGTTFAAGIYSLCAVEGDFDIQVDYQLVVWPSRSGVRTGLSAVSQSGFSATVQRDSLSANDVPVQTPGSEVYLTDFEPHTGVFLDVPTSDMQGTLRLNRAGGSVTAYFASPGKSWTIVASTAAPSEPVTLAIQAWSGDNVFNKQSGGAQVRFRNFAVNTGRLSCPDAGIVGVDGSFSAAEAGSATDVGNVAEAGSAVEVGKVAEAGSAVEVGKVIDVATTVDTSNAVDAAANVVDAGSAADGMVVASDGKPPEAKDAGGGNVAPLKIAAKSGCSCFVVGPMPSGGRLPLLFILGLSLVALVRRRHP
jgi:hypothetical protein